MICQSPIILKDYIIGQDYLKFLQNALSEQLEDIPLATRHVGCVRGACYQRYCVTFYLYHSLDIK